MTAIYTVLILEDCAGQRCCVLGVRESSGESYTKKEIILVQLVQNAEKQDSKSGIFSPLLLPRSMAPAVG